jgi:hypothetical protein
MHLRSAYVPRNNQPRVTIEAGVGGVSEIALHKESLLTDFSVQPVFSVHL